MLQPCLKNSDRNGIVKTKLILLNKILNETCSEVKYISTVFTH